MAQNTSIDDLLRRYLDDRLTPAEYEQLLEWLQQKPENDSWVELLSELGMERPAEDGYDPGRWQPMIEAILRQQQQLHAEDEGRADETSNTSTQQGPKAGPQAVVRLLKRRWLSVAAVFMMAIAAGVLYAVIKRQPAAPAIIAKTTPLQDVAPPSTRNAVITLSNGQKIVLDSCKPGVIHTQDNVDIVKAQDGQISYKSGPSSGMAYNSLYVPAGSKIVNITLSDGSRVWLNSASTLKYPVAFNGGDRKVEINGEAYFEIAHREGQTFKVQKGDLCITVLGTHFNVNSYDDDPAIKVTLLQGAVKIDKGKAAGILRPGQQATLSSSGMAIIPNADVDEAIAWKDGKFQFGEATDIKAIMRQLARWYNIKVIYNGNVTGNVGGAIARDIPVSRALKMLAMTGAFSFQIQDNNVIVKDVK
ncbi:MAG TPA: FecR domain-containing protein [Puia sp.]|nr:FecR domain-containing protein [Puia sp.]